MTAAREQYTKMSLHTRASQGNCPEVTMEAVFESSLRNDTLAYAFNFGNSEGFVLVANDDRVSPVLAYSDHGAFVVADNPIVEEICGRLPKYYSSVGPMQPNIERDTVMYVVQPKNLICLYQKAPYDRALVKDWPGQILGCVPVALATVMVNTMKTLQYGDDVYNLNGIAQAIYEHDNPGRRYPEAIFDGPSCLSYETAVNLMSELLYRLGLDAGIDYSKGYTANYTAGYELARRLGLPLNSPYQGFKQTEVVEALKSKNVVYARGQKEGSPMGHAWMIDGCRYCTVHIGPYTYYEDVYYHCNWGWNGRYDGFYRADVFGEAEHTFPLENCFFVSTTGHGRPIL